MKWEVKGADRHTGDEFGTSVEAPSRDEAIKLAGRTMFIEAISPAPDSMPIAVIPYSSAPEPATNRTLVILLSAFSIIILMIAVAYWLMGASRVAAIQSSSNPVPGTIVPPTAPPEPDVTIKGGKLRSYRGSNRVTTVWKIRSDNEFPITINRVVFNGEYSAKIADESDGDFYLGKREFPATLTIGESVLAFQNDTVNGGGYPKDVLYVEVYTNFGVYRLTGD